MVAAVQRPSSDLSLTPLYKLSLLYFFLLLAIGDPFLGPIIKRRKDTDGTAGSGVVIVQLSRWPSSIT